MPTIEHPGEYVNIIIGIGSALWVVISTLIIYIWRGNIREGRLQGNLLERRIKLIEDAAASLIVKRIETPMLGIVEHQALCGKNTQEVKELFRSELKGSTELLLQKINSMEVNIGGLIKIAVLTAQKNGLDRIVHENKV